MRHMLLFCVSTLILSACGNTVGEQTLAGGTVGAAGALILDADPIKGAVVGAAGNLIYCQTNPGAC